METITIAKMMPIKEGINPKTKKAWKRYCFKGENGKYYAQFNKPFPAELYEPGAWVELEAIQSQNSADGFDITRIKEYGTAETHPSKPFSSTNSGTPNSATKSQAGQEQAPIPIPQPASAQPIFDLDKALKQNAEILHKVRLLVDKEFENEPKDYSLYQVSIAAVFVSICKDKELWDKQKAWGDKKW